MSGDGSEVMNDDLSVVADVLSEPWRPAVESGDLQQLRNLVQERGLAVLTQNYRNEYGRYHMTPLLEAANLQHVDMVRYLVEECSSVVDIHEAADIMNSGADDCEDGFTSLHFAAQAENLELVRYFVEKGCDVNALAKWDKTPLHVAAEMKRVDSVKYLIDTGLCNLDLETDEDEPATALSLAAGSYNNLEIVQYLMERGPWTDQEKTERATKVWLCASDMEIRKYLVKHYLADVNADNALGDHGDPDYLDDYDETKPLNIACKYGCLETLQRLVEKCHVNAQSYCVGNLDSNPLLQATRSGHLDIVQYLVERCGAYFETEQSAHKDTTPFLWACESGKFELVQYFFNNCRFLVDIEATDTSGNTALHFASRCGELDMVQLLVEKCGSNVEAKNDDQWTALHLACNRPDPTSRWEDDTAQKRTAAMLVKYFVDDCNANVDVPNNQGETALFLATRVLNVEAVQYLLQSGRANVHAADHAADRTVMHTCIYYGRDRSNEEACCQIAKAFANAGYCNFDARDSRGRSILHLACEQGMIQLVQFLVQECRVNLDLPTHQGETALHLASRARNVEMVQCLIQSGRVNVNALDAKGRTVVQSCLDGGYYSSSYAKTCCQIAKAFATAGHSNFDVRNNDGRTILHLACEKEILQLVQFLVQECRVNLDLPNNQGETALHLASRARNAAMVQCLIQSGRVDINALDAKGRTVVQSCVDDGHCPSWAAERCCQVAKAFADAGYSNFEARDSRGRAILHMACESQILQMVQFLVEECRVNVDAPNNQGETALHLACRVGDVETVQFLVETGHANVNALDLRGRTAMHQRFLDRSFRRAERSLQIAKAFAEVGGFSFDTRDNDGQTILFLSCETAMLELLQFLVQECRVNVNVATNRGETALHVAARKRYVEIVRYMASLLQADVNAVDENDQTALQYACFAVGDEASDESNRRARGGYGSDDSSCYKIVQCLLETGRVNASVQDNRGKTALHHSFVNPVEIAPNEEGRQKYTQEVCLKIVQALTESGQVNVDAMDHTGQTILHYYCSIPNFDIPRYLIEQAHANIDVMDNEGRTALHRAASIARGEGARSGLRLILFLVSRLSMNLEPDEAVQERRPSLVLDGKGPGDAEAESLPKRQRSH